MKYLYEEDGVFYFIEESQVLAFMKYLTNRVIYKHFKEFMKTDFKDFKEFDKDGD